MKGTITGLDSIMKPLIFAVIALVIGILIFGMVFDFGGFKSILLNFLPF